MKYCLIEEGIFSKEHKISDGINRVSPKSYDRRKVKAALKRAMEFDHIKPKSVFTRVKETVFGLFNKNKALPEPTTMDDSTGNIVHMPRKNKASWEMSMEDIMEMEKRRKEYRRNLDAQPKLSNEKDRIE